MSEYIDRESLINHLNQSAAKHYSRAVERVIELEPAADVVPVRRGQWIPIHASELTGWNPEFAGCDPIEEYMCSRCGADAILSCNDDLVLSNYCPNCGAKMEVPNDD